MPTKDEQVKNPKEPQSNIQVSEQDQKFEQVNSVTTTEEQASLAQPKTSADAQAAKRDDVDDNKDKLPAEVTDQLLEGSEHIFIAAFKNAQSDGLSREGAMQVAWNSIKQGFQRKQDGSWHRKTKPDDNVLSSGVSGSAS